MTAAAPEPRPSRANLAPVRARSRPVDVSAMFFDGTPACGLLIQKWALLAGGSATYCELSPQFEMSFDDDMSTWVRVETPAGPAVAFRNYWVLFELDNGFSVVRGDVFDRTYDLLTDG